MIVVTGTMRPGGSQTGNVEVLHVSICNSGNHARGDDYMAHVLARPHKGIGVIGFEADVAITNHQRREGLIPLLMSTLGAAIGEDEQHGTFLPPARVLERTWLQELDQFDARLRGRN